MVECVYILFVLSVLITYLALFDVYVSERDDSKNGWCTVGRLKTPLWMIFISIFLMFVPIVNIIYSMLLLTFRLTWDVSYYRHNILHTWLTKEI